jgi:hypothetical protein
MAKDFKANQIRTSKIVISGSESGKPALLIYSASDATNFAGGYQSDMLTNVGSDVYLFVSGNNSSIQGNDRSKVTLFGGDVVVSGTFFAEKFVAEVNTSVNSDHYISGALYLQEKASEPDVAGNQAVVYVADDGGVSKLYFKNTDGVTEVGSGGGGGSGTVTSGSFNEVDNSNAVPTTFVTTSSLSLAGGFGISYGVENAGSDVFFFASGTSKTNYSGLKNDSVSHHSRSVFGGELVVSSSLYAEGALVGYKNIILNKLNDQSSVLGGIGRLSNTDSISFFNSGSASSGATTKIQGFSDSGGDTIFDYIHLEGASRMNAKRADILPRDGGESNSESMRPRMTFLSGGAPGSPNEISAADVAVFFSGSSNSLDEATRGSTLFGGDVATSGTLKITRNVAHNNQIGLMLNQGSTDAGNAGSISQTFVAGFSGYSTGDGSELSIQKYGPNNTAQMGGPFANFINAKSGSLILSVGGTTSEYTGNQAIALSDRHQSNFLVATGSKSSGTGRVLILSGGAAGSADEQTGTDVNFFVSGSSGSKDSSVRGTSIFGGDVVVSGTLYDGSGNTIGSGGGSITAASGSTSIGSVTQIDFTEAGILNNNGSGVAALTGTIGNPEDGSYADGLFTTFTPQTTIGVAIDKINEVLKFLAPSPAPGLDNVDADGAQGTTALLSFGTGVVPSGYTIVQGNIPGGSSLSAVNINQSYGVVTGSSGDLRLAIYNSSTTITGDLNSDVAVSDYNSGAITNHVAKSFGDADQGTLTLEVNGSDIVSVDLTDAASGNGVPGSGTANHYGTSVHSSTGFIQLSQTGSARTQSDTSFPIFQHRTGKFTIPEASQRKGYNYAKVKHTVGSTTTSTNFVEWVYDEDGTDSSNLIGANQSEFYVDQLDGGTNRYDMSGVRYAVTGSGEHRVRIENYYKHVYAQNSITTSISNCGSTSPSPGTVPSINTGLGEDFNKSIHVTSSFATTTTPMLGARSTATISVAHPTKTGLTNAGSVNSGRFLIYSGTFSSTNTFESFNHEDYRIQSGSFDSQTDFSGSYSWDSTKHMTASNGGHSDGLQFYNGVLISPLETINGGNFKSDTDLGSSGYFGQDSTGIDYIYSNQPDYSSESGLRTFYRAVKNVSSGPVSNFKIQLNAGTTTIPTIVGAGDSLNSTSIRVFAKLPGEPGSGWLDLGNTFTLGQTGNRDGGRSNPDLDSSASPSNFFTFGTGSLAKNDYLVVKIEADASLERDIGGITFTVPGNSSAFQEAPGLDAINSEVSGVDAKLSFGSSKTLSGFTNVSTSGGGSATDINQEFSVASNRYGVIGSDVSITGSLNHDVASNGNNYPADAFSADPAYTQIKMVLNGVDHHTMDLRNASTTGESKTSDSGFLNISAAANPTDSAGLVSDFTKWYRTGDFGVGSDDMVAGHNYVKIQIYNGTTWVDTNLIEWVRDTDSSALNITNSEFGSFGESNAQGFYYQSGVKYFQDPTGSFKSQVNHAYSSVYSPDSDAVSITSVSNFNNVSFTQITGSKTVLEDASSRQMALPALDTGLSDVNVGSLFVTGTIEFNQSTSIPGTSPIGGTSHSAAAKIDVKHPLDGTQGSGNIYVGGNSDKKFLVFSASLGSTNRFTSERFSREDFRIVSGNYTAQSDIISGNWDSTLSINDSGNTNYYSGLLVYNGNLVSPKDSRLPGSGDFRSYFDVGSSDLISPLSNVNYSSLPTVSSSHRHYYRSFENNTVNNVFNIDVTLFGDANIIGRAGALSGSLGSNDNIYIEGKIPGKTGWLDLGRATAGSGNITDGDGGLNGDIDQVVDAGGASNNLTFNGQTVNGTGTGAEKIVLKITAHKNWTGYISRIDVSY